MKKINVAKIIWIVSLFVLLIVILIMVMDYKINHQYKSNNKLYFYDCSGELCVTEVEDDDHLMYSSYNCEYEECPIYKQNIHDTYAILDKKTTSILYDYREGKIISNNYNNYQLLNNNYIIVTKNKNQGVINLNNELLVPTSYEQLGYTKDNNLIGYNLNSIIAKTNDRYGIISLKNGTIIEEFKYSEEEIESLLKILNKENTSIETN